MKKFLSIIAVFLLFCGTCQATETLSVKDLHKMGIVANSSITKCDLDNAKKIIADLQKENSAQIKKGYGPFLAVAYDKKGNVVAKMSNTVLKEQCCLNHAEMNTIRQACKNLHNFDLAPYHLTLYVTAEPCVMCMGGIMWSGIDKVYYSVSSKDVEKITGFDEGYKPNWISAFKTRHIKVYGNIEAESGREVLHEYVKSDNKIYKPSR